MADKQTGDTVACAPFDYPIAIIAFVVMLLAYGGHAMAYGQTMNRVQQGPEGEDDKAKKRRQAGMGVIVVALIAESIAVWWYYRQVMKCKGMQGFLVFIVMTAVATFVVASVVPPPKPRNKQIKAEANK